MKMKKIGFMIALLIILYTRNVRGDIGFGLSNIFTLDTRTTIINEIETIPREFVLFQNYPNPFNPYTKIEYSLPKDSYVELKIFNILGQEVKTLVSQRQSQGIYSIEWDGKTDNGINVVSGLYLYRLQAGKYVSTKKMLIIK
jgi:hypothetical protein